MIEVGEEQVLYFRARRGHLAGPGARNAVEAARAILGAQAQQPGPALLALGQRTKGRPAAAALKAQLLGPRRSLVRTWGQRETLHVYDPRDWAAIVAARGEWAPGGRRGPMPGAEALAAAARVLEGSATATRSDLLGVAPASYERALRKALGKYVKTAAEARRFAAGRLLWCLAMRGDACVADKVGAEQGYAARTRWFPRLKWSTPETRAAALELTRRYLALYGPATATDAAHFFGARVREARQWCEALRDAGEVVEVACGERRGLLANEADLRELKRKPPAKAGDWPPRLLPMWDTYLMGHADKSWTAPDPAERKKIWRGQAVVAAGVIARGRFVAEWSHEIRKDRLGVAVRPLSGWSGKAHLAAVKREATAVAAHLGLKDATVRVGR